MLILVHVLGSHELLGLNWTAGSRQKQRVVLDIAGRKGQQRPPGLGCVGSSVRAIKVRSRALTIEGCTCPTKLGMYLHFGSYLFSFFGQE